MQIYQHEIQDGLSDQIQNSVATASTISKLLASANPSQFDLFYMESVLASIGWNDNDDVFDPVEVWAAKNTPVDKQFNLMHSEKDIIGHITSSKIVANGKVVASDATEIPDKYDVVVGSVIYRNWDDPELQDRINKLIAEIKEGKWFVSMECLFANFDYALIDPEGQHKVLARNNDTSFLTKHLRAYGGKGEYEGYKLGRLLRDFAYSGKGLVNNPANKRSIIFNYSDFSDTETDFKVAAKKEQNMDREKELEAQLAKAEQKLEAAEKAAKDAADEAVAKEIQEYKDSIASLEEKSKALSDELKETKDKLTVAEEVQTSKSEKVEELETKVQELEKVLNEKTEALDKYEKEQARADRLAKFKDRDIDEAKAANLVDKTQDITDEAFEALVESFARMDKDDDKKKKREEEDKKKKEKEVAEATDDLLDDVDPDPEATLSIASEDIDEVREKTSAWLKDMFTSNKEKK